jgi:hypothetical protein
LKVRLAGLVVLGGCYEKKFSVGRDPGEFSLSWFGSNSGTAKYSSASSRRPTKGFDRSEFNR